MNTTNLFVLVGLVVIFPVLTLGGLKKPSFGLAALIFSLPILSQGYRLFLESQAPFPFLETTAVLVLWVFVQLHNIRHNPPLNNKNIEWDMVIAVFIFLFTGFLSAFFAYDSEIAYKILLVGGVSPLLCFFIAKRHINTLEDVRLVLLGFFGLVIQVALFTILAFDKRLVFAPLNADLFAWLYLGYLGQNPAVAFQSPSASIATIVASLSLAAWYRIYGRWNNHLIWSVVIVSTIGTALISLSRGSWLGIIVALVASLPLYFKRIQMRVIILVSLLLLALYFSGYYDFIFHILDTRLASQINSVDIRLANYQLALQASGEHIFSGLGLGNYQYLYSEFPFALASSMEPLWFAHSLFLTLIPEIGLTGMLAFAYIFVSRLIKGIGIFQKSNSDEERWFVFSLVVAVFSYIVVVSTSGGHLIATMSEYLIAPGLIVTMIFLGCLSSKIKQSLPANC